MSKTSLATKKVTDFSDFKKELASYKQDIETELEQAVKQMLVSTGEQFGNYPTKVLQAYTNVLMRGGKRIRGALAMASYQMFGGQDKEVIVKAAAALEMFNAYILVVDDIQDRSDTRRGGKTAHIQLADLHKEEHLKGDPVHFGEAVALNAFLIAQHYASNIILQLNVPDAVKNKALANINNCFIVTAHGQTMDLFSEATESLDISDVNNILEWKTAYYTFINPLQMGAILAGANQADMKSLEHFGVSAGRTFQITDDIIGTFGKESETGKSELDDIKEGKRTMLVVNAIKDSSEVDAYFLESCLGNQNITRVDFDRCKKIIVEAGALDTAKKEATVSANQAVQILQNNPNWPAGNTQFLHDLVAYLLVRKS
jgi:geranylgeranyl diphosphate synthase, type I